MKYLKYVILSMILATVLILSGCGAEEATITEDTSDRLKVVTTLFPQYDFVSEIGQDKVDVTLLLPPGVEAHSYEPTPQDIVNIEKSAMFVYTGEAMEPWAHKVVEASNDQLVVVDASVNVPLMEDGDEDHHHGNDPHIWLDPVLAQIMVDNIVDGLVEVDPENKAFYLSNGRAYQEKLEQLNKHFEDELMRLSDRSIVVGGHFAFGYLAHRYDIEVESVYEGFSPDAEPSPQKIAALIDLMKAANTKVIYHEELVDPKVARVIAAETGAELVMLHGAHNISKEELESGIHYIDIMEGNLQRLLQGMTE